MLDSDGEQRARAQKRAMLAELLREKNSAPVAAEPASSPAAKPVSTPVPIVPLSTVKDWNLEDQNAYIRHVTPYKGFLYQRLGLDKTFVRGDGCYLIDQDGTRYADFIAQYGAVPFGHDPEPIWRALESVRHEQRPNLTIASISAPAGELAERLVAVAPPGLRHMVFTNSGAEAVEASIKLARCRTGRFGILSAANGFHGLTLAGMSATDTDFFRRGFGAPAPGFSYVPFGDLAALESVLKARPDFFAAFLVEPIQGESGIRVAPPGYLAGAAELCRRHGTLLIFDEVQTGMGRTGTLFACEQEGVTPDIMTLAKALGGGLMPIGACLYSAEVYDEHFDLRHGSTFAGNTLACRAALATIEELTKDDRALVRHVADMGRYLERGLKALQSQYPALVKEIRGRGLMLGLELDLAHIADTQTGVLATLQEQKLLLYMCVSHLLNVERVRITTSFTHGNVLRIEPPLIADEGVCDHLLTALGRLLDTLERGDAGRLLGHMMGRPPGHTQPAASAPRRKTAPLLRQASQAGRTQFAFVAHPLAVGDLRRLDSSMETFGDAELEAFRSRIAAFVRPFPVGELLVQSAGRAAHGELIMLPYLPSEMLALPWDESVALVQNAVDMAVERGAKVIGLGGFSSIVVDGGLNLQVPDGVTITSGNSFTSWAAIRSVEAACAARGLGLADCTVAVVGAAGAIGHAVSLLCAERAGELILVGSPRAGEASLGKLKGVAQDCERHVRALAATGRKFQPGSFADRLASRTHANGQDTAATLTTDIDGYLPKAHVVITSTSAVLPFISSRHLGPGAIVCDVSRPLNVVPELADERPDATLLRGGLVHAPAASLLGLLEERDRPNVLVACAAETILLTLSGHRSPHLCGRLDIGTIEELGRLADRYGFSVAFDHHAGKDGTSQVLNRQPEPSTATAAL
jgi:acetylornithine/succinyldiaminopimelate/putrescine aminotransferase/predicted amino acid dehydrogenase